MKNAYVFVEGPTVADFLKKVLTTETQRDIEYVCARSGYETSSLARSILAMRRIPVAIFMDAHSLEPSVIANRRGNLEEILGLAAGGVPVKVVVAVPTLEACFFASPELLERVLGAKLSPTMLTLGQRDPRGVLSIFAAENKLTWTTSQAIGAMDARDIERIRTTAPIQELTMFLENIQKMQLVEK